MSVIDEIIRDISRNNYFNVFCILEEKSSETISTYSITDSSELDYNHDECSLNCKFLNNGLCISKKTYPLAMFQMIKVLENQNPELRLTVIMVPLHDD